MEIEDSAKSGIDPEMVEEAAEVLTAGGRAKYDKLSKAGIDRLFTPAIDRQEMLSILSYKLRQRDISTRYFIPLIAYYMQLRHWSAHTKRKRSGKKPVFPEADAEISELHELVTELEKQKGAN